MSADSYTKGLKVDKEEFDNYFKKSIVKTEQQKYLETLFDFDTKKKYNIADIACGGGTLTYHLSKIFTNSEFTLVDYLDDALNIAKDINKDIDKARYFQDDIYLLSSQPDNHYDFLFCWQTLSWLDEPQKALDQLIRITKPGGVIYLSSLFNLEHDVDIYSKVFDLTRDSGINKIPYSYNTYSETTVKSWLDKKADAFKLYKFTPGIDFHYSGKGIGTYTVNTNQGERLQISAGLLLNWAILKINK